MTDHAHELRRHARKIPHPQGETPGVMQRAADEIERLRAKIERMEKRLRLILEEPENTMSNSKAMREMLRQARLALEESK